jgi:hypothetical protein
MLQRNVKAFLITLPMMNIVDGYGRVCVAGSRFRTYFDFGYVALDVSSATYHDTGEYTVRATNQLGSAHTSTMITVSNTKCWHWPFLFYTVAMDPSILTGQKVLVRARNVSGILSKRVVRLFFPNRPTAAVEM